jgi:hypothetical protein
MNIKDTGKNHKEKQKTPCTIIQLKNKNHNMKSKLVLFVALLAFTSVSFAQQNSTWDKWNWVMGKWTGEGSGEPGKGDGTFSFSLDLDKKVIIRKSHSEYSATDTKPSVIHDDLMIVYVDMDGNPSKAIYFDTPLIIK